MQFTALAQCYAIGSYFTTMSDEKALPKAKPFGSFNKESAYAKQRKEEALYNAKQERLWELLTSDFANFKNQCKIDHPDKLDTLMKVFSELEQLKALYESAYQTPDLPQ